MHLFVKAQEDKQMKIQKINQTKSQNERKSNITLIYYLFYNDWGRGHGKEKVKQ